MWIQGCASSHSWYPLGYTRSSLTTQGHYAMLFTLSPRLCSPPSMSSSSVLSQSFCCVHSKTLFSLKFLQPKYFSPSACINLIIHLVTFCNLSFDTSHPTYSISPSFHRYTAVVMPVHYQQGTGQSSCRRVALMITAVWLLSFAVSCPLLFGFNTTGNNDSVTCNTQVIHSTSEWLWVLFIPEMSDLKGSVLCNQMRIL